jgi:general secretion pathway protein K
MPLLYVLWSIALLTIIATATLGSGTVAYRQTRNLAEVARQEAIAEAAVNRAVLALLDPRPERRWPVNGVPQSFTFTDTPVTVTIQDELGRVDINHADTPLLTAAFRAAGLSAQAATEMADKILEWRDKRQTTRTHGATIADYAAAGLAYLPRNPPFQSVDELKLVLGITPQIFARAEPLLTVHSGRPAIDPQFAPRALLDALSGRENASADVQNIPAHSARTSGTIGANISLDGRAFAIRVTLGKAGVIREAVVRITTNPAKPYWQLNWRIVPSKRAPS